jgi:DNA invertase Pin-like site-specific DNA recombinase/predicted metal-binding protein
METKPTMRYAVYARKSSDSEDRQVLSIESQIDELKKLAQGLGLDLNSLDIRPESHSAKIPSCRPVWKEIVSDVNKGKLNGIIAWHANRLSRNSVDTGEMIYLMDQGKLVEVVTPSQAFRGTPNDKMMLNFFCTIAKYENDNKGVDVKRGLQKKADMGYLPNGAKPGYMNDPYAEKGNKRIKNDPERFPIIKEAWRMMLTGYYTPPEILKKINNELGYRTPRRKTIGGKPMARSQLYQVFSDPFYYGTFEFPLGSGNWKEGKHEPMVTEEEFWRVQQLLGRKERQRPHKHSFPYTGIIRCGQCGSMVTAEHKAKLQASGKMHFYIYYHCTWNKDPNCTQRVIEVKDLEDQITKKIASLKIPAEVHEFAMKWFRKENEKVGNERQDILKNAQNAYQNTMTTINGLIDMRARGEIDEENYRNRMESLKREKNRLESLTADIGNQAERWMTIADDAFTFVERALEKFEKGSPDVRRRLFMKLASNRTLIDKKLNVDVEETLVPMEIMRDEDIRIRDATRTAEKSTNIRSLEDFYLESPVMLPTSDLNPVKRGSMGVPEGRLEEGTNPPRSGVK